MREDTKNTKQIRKEIEDIRRDISYDVDKIFSKLTPGAIVDQLVLSLRRGSSSRNNLYNLKDRIKNNPLAIVLMGTGAWIFINDKRYESKALQASRQKGEELKSQTVKKGHELKEKAVEKKNKLKFKSRERAKELKTQLREKSKETSVRGKIKSKNVIEKYNLDSSISMGATGLAVGLILGGLIPSSRKEKEVIAPRRRVVKRNAKERFEEAKEIGKRGLNAAKEEVNRSFEEKKGPEAR